MDHNGNSHPSQPPNPHDHAQLLAQRQADDAVMHQLATVGVTPQQYAENLQRLQALASMNEVGLRVYAQRQAELAQEGRLAEQRLQQLNEMGILPNQVQGRPVARIQGPPTPVQPAQPYAHAPAAQTWTQAVPVQPTPSSSAAQTPRPAPQHPFNPHSYPYQPYYPPAHYQASNANLRSQSSQNVHYSGGHVAPAKAQATGSTVAGTQSSLNTSGTSGPGHTYAQPVVNRQSERPLSSTSHTEEVRRHPEQEHFGLPSRQPLRPPSHQQPGLPLNHQGRPEGQPGAPQARADGQAERILTFDEVRQLYPELIKRKGPEEAQKIIAAYLQTNKIPIPPQYAPKRASAPSSSSLPESNSTPAASSASHPLANGPAQPMRSNVPLPHPQDPKQGFVFIQDPASRPLSTPFAQQFTSLAQASVDGAPHATQQRPFNPPPPQPSNAAQWHSIPPNATTVAPSSRKIPSPAPTSNPPIPTTPAVSAPAVKVQSPHSASKSTLAKDILRSLRGGSLFASPAKVTPPSQGDAAVGDKRKRRESDVGEHLEDPQVLKKTVLEQAKQGVDLVELPMSAWMESDSDGLNRDQSPFHEQIELPAPQPSYLQGPHQNEAGFTAHTPIDLTSDSDRSQARTPHSDILADGNLLSSGVIPLEGFFPPADEVNMNLEYPDRTPTPPLEATIRPVEDEDEVINVTTVDELPDASDDYDLDIVNVGAPLVPLVNATPSPSLAASEESTFVKRPGLLDAESPEEPPETSTSTPDRALRREFTPETESKTKRSLKVYVLVPSPPPYVRQLRAREARRRQGSQDEKEEDSTRAASDHMQRRPCGWTGCPVTLNSEEALLLHVQEHLGDVGEPRKAQSRIVACQWKSCREVKAAGMMKNHLAGHATGEMYCPYEGCDQWFRQDGQLHRHEQTHGEHEALRPSTKPFRPDLGEGLPPLSKVVPTWMSATRKVATEPISQDRHSKLGPWVLRRIFGHVNLESLRAAGSARHSLRLVDRAGPAADSADADAGTGAGTGADTPVAGTPPLFRVPHDEYDFLEEPSYRTRRRVFADIKGPAIQRLLREGIAISLSEDRGWPEVIEIEDVASPLASRAAVESALLLLESAQASPQRGAGFEGTTLDRAALDALFGLEGGGDEETLVGEMSRVGLEKPLGNELSALARSDGSSGGDGDADVVEGLL